jgi:hypothetical protein
MIIGAFAIFKMDWTALRWAAYRITKLVNSLPFEPQNKVITVSAVRLAEVFALFFHKIHIASTLPSIFYYLSRQKLNTIYHLIKFQ